MQDFAYFRGKVSVCFCLGLCSTLRGVPSPKAEKLDGHSESLKQSGLGKNHQQENSECGISVVCLQERCDGEADVEL